MGPSGWGQAGAGSEEPSYEELCRAHMEALISQAAAHGTQSELSMRVSNWRTKIDPVLHAEETRAAFDIQSYGQQIMDKMAKLKLQPSASEQQREAEEDGAGEPAAANDVAAVPVVSFSAVASRPVKYEVSRSFAAMLQLINNRNIAIEHSVQGRPEAPFRLQLLTSTAMHEVMSDALAAGAAAPRSAAAAAVAGGPSSSQAAGGKAAGAAKAGKQRSSQPKKQQKKGGRKAAAVQSSSEDDGAHSPDDDIENVAGPGSVAEVEDGVADGGHSRASKRSRGSATTAAAAAKGGSSASVKGGNGVAAATTRRGRADGKAPLTTLQQQ